MADVIRLFDAICNWCIRLSWDMTEIFDKSYGWITTIAYLFIEPAAVLFFMIAAISFMLKKTKTSRAVALISFSLGTLSCVVVVAPLLYAIIVR